MALNARMAANSGRLEAAAAAIRRGSGFGGRSSPRPPAPAVQLEPYGRTGLTQAARRQGHGGGLGQALAIRLGKAHDGAGPGQAPQVSVP